MRPNLRRKRFVISLIILVCGVFALYPYLAGVPRREVIRNVSGLEDRGLAVSVIKDVFLGDALTDRTHSLSLPAQLRGQLAKLRVSLKALKKELSAMPAKSPQLTEPAAAAYQELSATLTAFVAALPESAGR